MIFSRDEFKQDQMSKYFNERLRFFLGDIRDRERIQLAMDDVDFVVHAAALKASSLLQNTIQWNLLIQMF